VLAHATSWREPTSRQAEGSTSSSEERSPKASIIEFRGYAYTRAPSPISGELVTIYDPSTPQIWRVPLRKNTEPSLVMAAPRGGYIVTAAHAPEIGAKLALHGIASTTLATAIDAASVQCFRAEQAQFSSTPFEGRMRVELQGAWREEQRTIPAGSLFVPIQQPLARLVMALLEPEAPDSLAAWGFFNSWFEQKEYIEPYVAEIIAREMLKDADLAAEFDRRLQTDASFASDPNARREFFHRRHPSWDERFNLYPVYRTATVLVDG
jgi:hypothetical protein